MSDWQGAMERAQAEADARRRAEREEANERARAKTERERTLRGRVSTLTPLVLRLRDAWIEAGMPGSEKITVISLDPGATPEKFRVEDQRRPVKSMDMRVAVITKELGLYASPYDKLPFGNTTSTDRDNHTSRHPIKLVLLERLGPAFKTDRISGVPGYDCSGHPTNFNSVGGLDEVANQRTPDQVMAELAKWCVEHRLKFDL